MNDTPQPGSGHHVPKSHALKRMYYWVLDLAEHPHALTALFLVAVAEASFFPIPPDVLLLAMAVSRPERAMTYAAVSTLGSVIGGILGYLMGWGLWSAVDTVFYQYIPGFTPEKFAQMSQAFSENTFATMFTAGFTPVPFKVFTIAAGASLVPFVTFVVASVISRGLRYGLLAGIVKWCGPQFKDWIDRYFDWLTIGVTALILAFFAYRNFN